MQFRAESFNLFNTPQFNTPNRNLQDNAFGQITATQAGSERKFQMSLRVQF